MSRPDYLSFIRNHTGTLLFFTFFLAGVLLIVFATVFDHNGLAREVTRDIGIGCMVAAIVGGVYDVHARSRFDIETMSGVLGAIMGDLVRGDVWNEIKDRILNKGWIREPLSIDISVKTDPEGHLPAGMMILWMRMTYGARNLKSVGRTELISHRLDFHRSYRNLPRFTSIRYGTTNLSQAALDKINMTDGVFDQEISLEPSRGRPVRVRIEREELIYVPGSYNLVMSAIAKDIRVSLQGMPVGYVALVNIRPHKDNPLPLAVNDELNDELDDVLFLPGQVIEFIFARQASSEAEGGRQAPV